jgi:uncharacterized Zn-binding protein involved in type VI secretion
MSRDIIPSFYGKRTIGNLPLYDGNLFGNIKLRQGQVSRIVSPTDKDSVSGLFFEYDVVVSQYEVGTIGHRKYKNCLLINPLAGGGDRAMFTLRPSTIPVGAADDTGSTDPYPDKTDGSRVLILCVEGSNNQAVILGGLRDERSGIDDEKKKHHLEFEFNGVNFQVNDDGSWTCENKGKTTNLGKPDKNRDKGAGTTIKVEANGNFSVASPNNNQEIVIDNTKNTITINGDKDVTINGNKIHCGANADQQGVLGNELVSILKETLTACASIVMMSVAGSPLPLTSPPINAAQFTAISAKLDKILSNQTYLKR